MGQYAVIAVVAALVFAAVLLFNAQLSTEAAGEETGAYQVDRFAREAALVGLKRVERNLAADTDGWELWAVSQTAARNRYAVATTPHGTDGATYTVAIDSFRLGTTPTDPDRVWVTATGTYDGWNAATGATATTDFVVKASYETGLTDIGVPPGMRDAIQTEQDLTIAGNGCVSGAVHANGDLGTQGGAFEVLGPGTYTTSESSNHDQYFTGGILPSDSVYIPMVDIPPSTITHTITGDFTLDATTDPATTLPDGWFGVTGHGDAGDAYILYINGNLTINGDVRLIGYSGLYVNGTVTIGGNSTIAPVPASAGLPVVTANMTCSERMAAIGAWADANLPNGSQMGIFAQGDIRVGGNTNIVSHLTSNASFTYTGGGNANRLVIGGITSQNDLTLAGNTMVYYTEPSDEIQTPGSNDLVPEGVRLIAYHEWAARP